MIQDKIEARRAQAAKTQNEEINISLNPTWKTIEVARYFRVSRKTVLNWARSNMISFERHGCQFVFKSEDVKKLKEVIWKWWDTQVVY